VYAPNFGEVLIQPVRYLSPNAWMISRRRLRAKTRVGSVNARASFALGRVTDDMGGFGHAVHGFIATMVEVLL